MRAPILAAVAFVAVTVPGAAADLSAPPRLGACGPVEGGFLLPGTDACLTLSGFARAEAGWRMAAPAFALAAPGAGATLPRAPVRIDPLGRSTLSATARLTADIRMPTELGPLRAYVSLRARNGGPADRDAR